MALEDHLFQRKGEDKRKSTESQDCGIVTIPSQRVHPGSSLSSSITPGIHGHRKILRPLKNDEKEGNQHGNKSSQPAEGTSLFKIGSRAS